MALVVNQVIRLHQTIEDERELVDAFCDTFPEIVKDSIRQASAASTSRVDDDLPDHEMQDTTPEQAEQPAAGVTDDQDQQSPDASSGQTEEVKAESAHDETNQEIPEGNLELAHLGQAEQPAAP